MGLHIRAIRARVPTHLDRAVRGACRVCIGGRVTIARVVCPVWGTRESLHLDGAVQRRIRLRGRRISPESTLLFPRRPLQCGGAEAREMNRRLVEGKTVDLDFDVQQRDKYGRLLAYVRTKDGTLVNTELVFRGFAGAATYPPNVRYADYFRDSHRRRYHLPNSGQAGDGTRVPRAIRACASATGFEPATFGL